MELTVPCEDMIEVSRELKKSKHCGNCVRRWEQRLEGNTLVDGGGMHRLPNSVTGKLPQRHWFSGADSTKHLNRKGEIAQRASNSIWKWSHFRNLGWQESYYSICTSQTSMSGIKSLMKFSSHLLIIKTNFVKSWSSWIRFNYTDTGDSK